MSEISTDIPVVADAATAESTVIETVKPETDYKAEAEKWKALSRQNETQAKANAEKARQFDAVEDANKSELQKAQDALTASEAKATAAEQRALKADISRTSGVPAELLTGATAEELTASAEIVLAFAKTQRPQPVVASGAELAGSGETGQITEAQLAQMTPEQTYKAHREGKLSHLF